MARRIQFRRDTTANWEAYNPILADGEIGIDKTTAQFKLGNGVDTWTDLSYSTSAGLGGTELPDITLQSSGNESTVVDVLVNNYDSSNLYDYIVSGGTLDITSNPFKWTLPEVTSDTQHSVTIFSTEVGKTTSATKKLLTVLSVNMTADDVYTEVPLKGVRYVKSISQGTTETDYTKISISTDATNVNADVNSGTTNNLLKTNNNIVGRNIVAKTNSSSFFNIDNPIVTVADNTIATTNYLVETQEVDAGHSSIFSMSDGGFLRVYTSGELKRFDKNMVLLSSTKMGAPKYATSIRFNYYPLMQVVDNYLFLSSTSSSSTTYHAAVIDLNTYMYVGDCSFSTDINCGSMYSVVFDGKQVCLTGYNNNTTTTAQADIFNPFSFGTNISYSTSYSMDHSAVASIVPAGDNSAFIVMFTASSSGNVTAVAMGKSGNITLSTASRGLTSTTSLRNFTIHTHNGESYSLNNGSLVKFKVNIPATDSAWSNSDFPAGSIQVFSYGLGGTYNGIYHDVRTNYTYLIQQSNILKAFREDFTLLGSATVPINFSNYTSTSYTNNYPIYLDNNSGYVVYTASNSDNTYFYTVTTDALGVSKVTYDINVTPYSLAEPITEAYISPVEDIALDVYMDERGFIDNNYLLNSTITNSTATVLPTRKLENSNILAKDAGGTTEALVNVVVTENSSGAVYNLDATVPNGTLATSTASTVSNAQGWLLDDGSYLVTNKYTSTTLYFEKWSSDFTTITNYTSSIGFGFSHPKSIKINNHLFATVTAGNDHFPRVTIFNTDTDAINTVSVTTYTDNTSYDFGYSEVDLASDGEFIYVVGTSSTTTENYVWKLDLDGNYIDTLINIYALKDKYGTTISNFNYWMYTYQSAVIRDNKIILSARGATSSKDSFLEISLDSYEIEEVSYHIGAYKPIMHTRNLDNSKFWLYRHPADYTGYMAKQSPSGNIEYYITVGTLTDNHTATGNYMMRLSDSIFIVVMYTGTAYIIKDTGTSFNILYETTTDSLAGLNNNVGARDGYYVVDPFKNKLIMNFNNGGNLREIDLTNVFDTQYDLTFDSTAITPTSLEVTPNSTIYPTVTDVVQDADASIFTFNGANSNFRAAKVNTLLADEVYRINLQLDKAV